MILLGRALLILSLVLLLAAIWLPAYLWQLLPTALLIFVVAGGVLGSRPQR